MYHDQKAAGGYIGGAVLGASHPAYDQAKQTSSPIGAGRDRGMLEMSADGIANSIGELGSCIDLLESCLASVLQPCPPAAATGTGSNSPTPMCSPSVGYLQEQRRRVEMLVQRVNDIRSRLDT